MSLYREVHPVPMTYTGSDRESLLLEVERKLVDLGIVERGDLVLMTIGTPIGKSGGTNTLQIVRVGDRT